ncbi:DNA methyltransferase [Bradyrhizobium sp. USDA 4451]
MGEVLSVLRWLPEAFANEVLESLNLKPGPTVLDPWNGSGTTSYAAIHRGHKAIGLDLNPVMVIISRARMLPFSEIDALEPLANTILKGAARKVAMKEDDPLPSWFSALVGDIRTRKLIPITAIVLPSASARAGERSLSLGGGMA